ncbi:MAG: DMT family transporter [Sphaerospermopsis sp.]|nr:DMT family transporter [Sphaerospermopsis sp.]
MIKIISLVPNLINKIPNNLFLWLAVLIFGAANAVTRKLTEIGAENFVGQRNPISFCNVLFVGNLCALLMLIAVYRRQLNMSNFRQISSKSWLSMSAAAILSGAIGPGLVFAALATTMVTNVVLVGRIETPLGLALAMWILNTRVHKWTILGAMISFLGVFVTVLLQGFWENMTTNNSAFITIGTGEIMTIIAAIASAIANIISQSNLQQIPLGLFSVFRTTLATIVFFLIAIILHGPEHFMDVFSPFLWQWMLIYGGVIVVLGQLSWFNGLKTATASDISLASSFTPIAGVLTAYFILQEVPTAAQYIGGAIILLGIFLNQIGIQAQNTRKNSKYAQTNRNIAEIKDECGFKGM